MHPVDPRARQIGQCRQVYLVGQPRGLEAAHLAGGGGALIQPAAIHHRAHRRIVRQTVGIVDILIAGEPAEHRLAEQPYQQMSGVLAAPTFCQHGPGQIGQAECVIQFAVGKQAGVRGDAATMEYQPQTAVEIEP
jgi:hypothetical protein